MSASVIELSAWIEKLKTARNRTELFAMLDQFRILEWTDEQRSAIAKLYMRLIDVLPHEDSNAAADADKNASDKAGASDEQEEVWYEKM